MSNNLGSAVLELTGDSSPLDKALAKAHGGVTSWLGKVTAVAAGVLTAGLFQRLSSTVMDAVTSVGSLGSATITLQRQIGGTAEESSGLLAVFGRYGMGVDDASRSLGIFSKHLQGITDLEDGLVTGGKSFNAVMGDLGISLEDATGAALPMYDVLLNTADAFKVLPDGAEKTARAMTLFGKSGKDMIPILNLGKQGMLDAMATAEKYGMVLSGDNVDSIKKFNLSQKDMNQALGGLTIQLGAAAMPALAKLSEWAATAAQTFNTTIMPVLKKIVEDLGVSLAPALAKASDWFKTLGDTVSTLMGYFSGTAGFDVMRQWFGPEVGQAIDAIVRGVKDFIPYLTTAFDLLSRGDLGSAFNAILAGVQRFAADIRPYLAAVADAFFASFGIDIGPLMGALDTFVSFVQANLQPILAGLAAMIAVIVVPAFISWAMAAGAAAIATVIAMAPLIAIVAAVGIAVGLLTAVWQSNWGDIQGKVAAVVAFIQGVLAALPGFLQGIGNQLGAWGQQVGAQLGAWGQQIGAIFAGLWAGIQAIAGAVWEAILANLRATWNDFAGIVNAGIAVVNFILQAGWYLLSNLAQTFWNAFGAQITAAWQAATAETSAAWAAISGMLSQVWNTLLSLGTQIFDALAAGLSIAWDAISAATSAVWGAVSSAIGAAMGEVSTNISRVLNNITTWWQTATDKITGFVQGCFNTVADWFRQMGDKAQGAFDVLKRIGDKIAGLLAAIQSAFNTANDIISRWPSAPSLPTLPTFGEQPLPPPALPPATAEGGIVSRPQIRLVGEAGPEAIIPLSQGAGLGNTYTVNVSGIGLDEVADEIERRQRRLGLLYA